MCSGNQIVISPQGLIGVCHEGIGEKRTFVSNINDNGFNFYANQDINSWAKRSPFNMLECIECEALGICGGGCPYGAMLKTGSIHEVDKRFCVHSKETLEWLIWDLFDKVKQEYETTVS